METLPLEKDLQQMHIGKIFNSKIQQVEFLKQTMEEQPQFIVLGGYSLVISFLKLTDLMVTSMLTVDLILMAEIKFIGPTIKKKNFCQRILVILNQTHIY